MLTLDDCSARPTVGCCHASSTVCQPSRAITAAGQGATTTRNSAVPAATRHEILTKVVEPARARGLSIGTGHFLYEVRPPVPFSKGAAVGRLLEAGGYAAALACGDDLTDVTAFAAVHDWSEADARRTGCALAAITSETPRPVIDAADVQVRATPGVTAALRRLLAAVGG